MRGRREGVVMRVELYFWGRGSNLGSTRGIFGVQLCFQGAHWVWIYLGTGGTQGLCVGVPVAYILGFSVSSLEVPLVDLWGLMGSGA